jgi:hypothetical protein
MARAPAPLLPAFLAALLPAPAQDRAAGSSAAGDIRAAVAQAFRDADAPVEFIASDIAARHGRDAVCEAAIAHWLAVLLNDPQLNAGLKALAATDSPRAAAARLTLQEIERRGMSPGGGFK